MNIHIYAYRHEYKQKKSPTRTHLWLDHHTHQVNMYTHINILTHMQAYVHYHTHSSVASFTGLGSLPSALRIIILTRSEIDDLISVF